MASYLIMICCCLCGRLAEDGQLADDGLLLSVWPLVVCCCLCGRLLDDGLLLSVWSVS